MVVIRRRRRRRLGVESATRSNRVETNFFFFLRLEDAAGKGGTAAVGTCMPVLFYLSLSSIYFSLQKNITCTTDQSIF